MKIRKRILIGITALLTGAVYSEIFYVDQNFQGEAPSGRSWLSAFPLLQTALDTAKAGDEIWVKAGVYKPLGTTRAATFQLHSNIPIYGGFRGTETTRNERNPRANRTVLSGDLGRSGMLSDNCYHVVVGASEGRIDGFIISLGYADGTNEKGQGGALLLPKTAHHFTIANCIFEKNHATLGGAIALAAADTTLTNCTLYANSSDVGGAVLLHNNAATKIERCTFTANYAKQSGGAIALRPTAQLSLANSWFLSNRTDGTGGAISGTTETAQGIKLEINQSVFSGNIATKTGGALFNHGPFTANVTQCSFKKNVSINGAGVVCNQNGATFRQQQITLSKNISAEGVAEIDTANASQIVQNIPEKSHVTPVAPDQKIKRLIDNVTLHINASQKLPLHTLLSKKTYTVLITGDLTDPKFIASYRNIEAAARDYSKKGVQFFYLYSYLLHPENHGYIQPFTLRERYQHVILAKQLLHTQVNWLYDTIDNQAAQALDRGENNLFILNQDNREEFAGNTTQLKDFREALKTLAGEIRAPTPAHKMKAPEIAPVNHIQAPFIDRVEINPQREKFQALQITPTGSRIPYYAKMRVEANAALLETGNGHLYLGFHLDPLYKTEWNNLARPLSYTIKVPRGIAISPSINTAQKAKASTDKGPREFILDVRKWNAQTPIPIIVNYTIHSTQTKRTIKVEQRYLFYLKLDPFGGTVLGRQTPKFKLKNFNR